MRDRDVGTLNRLNQGVDINSPTFNTDLGLTLLDIYQQLNAKMDDIYSEQETPISRHFIPIFGRYDYQNATYRQAYRVAFDLKEVTSGNKKSIPHKIQMEGRMAIINIWAVGTQTKENGWSFARQIGTPYVTIDDTNINVTADNNFDQCFVVVEYIRVLDRKNQ